jgi:hypothetical protein
MYTIFYSTIVFATIHIGFQLWENKSSLQKYFKHNGELSNRIASSFITMYIVSKCFNNIIKSVTLHNLLCLSSFTIDIQYLMLGYFTYESIFMLFYIKYYKVIIIHHIVSISANILLCIYNPGNNIINNTLVILMELPTPILQLYKINTSLYPKLNINKYLLKLIKKIYFINRILLFSVWLILSPFTIKNRTWEIYYLYTVFIILYIASLLWYKKML